MLQLDLDQAYANLSAKVMLTRAERSGVMGWIDKLARRPAKTDSDDGPIGVSGAISLDGEHGMQDEDIPLDGLFSLGQRLVVTGGPGCGKTTVLLHIAWALASAIADGNTLAKDKLGLDAPLPLPIFVPLAAYARHLRQLKGKPNAEGERRLSHFINQYLLRRDADFDLPADFFNCLLRDGQSVALLLDGLDEVSNEDERAMVRQAAEELVQGRPDMRVVVTCRTAAYHDQTALGSHFREIIVKPLEEAQVREMVQRFYGCIHTQEPKLAEERTGELLEGVNTLERARQSRGDERLIGSPLMVRLLLIVHYNERRMPDQRAELFMKAAEAMIQLDYLPDVEVAQGLKDSVGGNWQDHYEMMQHLAHHLHSQGQDQGREIDEDALRAAFAGSSYEPYVDALVDYTRNRSGLLEERLGLYRFIHLGFQEFLTARHLVEEIGVEAAAKFLCAGRLGESWWREVALLIPGYCMADKKSNKARAFIRALLNWRDATALQQITAAETAATALLELRESDERLRADVLARLLELFEDKASMLAAPARWRFNLGVALGKLGDPRPYVTDVDAMHLCAVPPGPFCMGSAADEDNSYDDEKPQSPQFAQDDWYAIGQHPISNAQFAQFVDEGGYTNPEWWRIAIADGVWQAGQVTRRWLIIDKERKSKDKTKYAERSEQANRPHDYRAPFNLPNHPVVGINWYEAIAFCEWLTARWQAKGWLNPTQRVQLPNEPEWEKSARGGLQIPGTPIVVVPTQLLHVTEIMTGQSSIVNSQSTRRYAWGNMADSERGNYSATELNATSALGCFPNPDSPYGCEDLSGNVWEWTRSQYGPWQLKDGDWSVKSQYKYPYRTDEREKAEGSLQHMARVLRGGSWDDTDNIARVAQRVRVLPDYMSGSSGFRVVVGLAPSSAL